MAGSWNVEEIKALIAIWEQENVQSQLQMVHRNCMHDVYQHITMGLEENGNVKRWQQCRTKIKNPTQKLIQEGSAHTYTRFTFSITYLDQRSQ